MLYFLLHCCYIIVVEYKECHDAVKYFIRQHKTPINTVNYSSFSSDDQVC